MRLEPAIAGTCFASKGQNTGLIPVESTKNCRRPHADRSHAKRACPDAQPHRAGAGAARRRGGRQCGSGAGRHRGLAAIRLRRHAQERHRRGERRVAARQRPAAAVRIGHGRCEFERCDARFAKGQPVVSGGAAGAQQTRVRLSGHHEHSGLIAPSHQAVSLNDIFLTLLS